LRVQKIFLDFFAYVLYNIKMKIIDNFLNLDDFNTLKQTVIGRGFPWFYSKVLSTLPEGQYNYQFIHVFYTDFAPNSNYFDSILPPIIAKLDPKALIRVKANLQPVSDKIVENGMHSDVDDATTAILYLNTNNGYTKFKTGEKIESLENRIVIFDSNLEHTGTTCTDAVNRLVLNINYVRNLGR